jgi:hypothetical protein
MTQGEKGKTMKFQAWTDEPRPCLNRTVPPAGGE